MHPRSLLVSLAALIGIAAESAFAQFPVGVRGGGLLDLALHVSVLNELGIARDAPAVAKIRTMSRDMHKEVQEELARLVPDGQSNRQELVTKAQASVQAKYDPQLKKLLTPEQYTRLKQIYWQSMGVNILNDPEVATALEITQEQREKLVALNRDLLRSAIQALNRPGGPAEGVNKKVRELGDSWAKNVREILSEEQQKKLTANEARLFNPVALSGPEAAKELDLTQEQQEKLVALNKEFTAAQQKIFQEFNTGTGRQPDDEETQKKMQAAKAEREQKLIDILSKTQQEKLAAMKGKPFDLALLNRPSVRP